jgi:hypothetical protein
MNLFNNFCYFSFFVFRIQFSSASCCETWTKKILDEISPPVKVEGRILVGDAKKFFSFFSL